MSKFSKAVLTAFGIAAKDAEKDELEALTDLASVALDSKPAEPAEEAQEEAKEAPAPEEKETEDEMVEKAPKGDDLGTKLDKLIEMVGALMKTKVHDEDPEDEDKDEETEEKSEVIEEEETEDGCGAKDAAEFLEALAPAIRGISDKEERARVSDAILAAVKDADVDAIFRTSRAAATKAADASGKTSYEKACAAQESAYASRNPHTKKEA